MRKLITHDAFMAFRVLNEIGVKEEMAAMANALRERGKTKFDQKAQVAVHDDARAIAGAYDNTAETDFFAFHTGGEQQ